MLVGNNFAIHLDMDASGKAPHESVDTFGVSEVFTSLGVSMNTFFCSIYALCHRNATCVRIESVMLE